VLWEKEGQKISTARTKILIVILGVNSIKNKHNKYSLLRHHSPSQEFLHLTRRLESVLLSSLVVKQTRLEVQISEIVLV